MKNELTPLQAWEEVKDEMLEWTEGYEENFDIIETALKRLEQYESETQSIGEMIGKKLKAFEIIKERNIDVCLIKNTKNYDEYCHEFALKVLTLKDEKCFVKNKGITEEEYDLLKEILCH